MVVQLIILTFLTFMIIGLVLFFTLSGDDSKKDKKTEEEEEEEVLDLETEETEKVMTLEEEEEEEDDETPEPEEDVKTVEMDGDEVLFEESEEEIVIDDEPEMTMEEDETSQETVLTLVPTPSPQITETSVIKETPKPKPIIPLPTRQKPSPMTEKPRSKPKPKPKPIVKPTPEKTKIDKKIVNYIFSIYNELMKRDEEHQKRLKKCGTLKCRLNNQKNQDKRLTKYFKSKKIDFDPESPQTTLGDYLTSFENSCGDVPRCKKNKNQCKRDYGEKYMCIYKVLSKNIKKKK